MVTSAEPLTHRPVRKIKPPAKKAEKTGLEWSTSGVPRLYLDDIEAIFEVMQEYSKHSEYVQVHQRAYEVIRDAHESRRRAYEGLEQIEGEREGGKPPTEPSPELPKPAVEIETDKYKEIFSIEALTGLNETKARELQMNVGALDVWFRFTPRYCSLRTSKNDSHSTEAFNKIRGILEERSVKAIGLIHSLRFWIGYGIVLAVTAVLYSVFQPIVLAWAYTILVFTPFIAWPYIFGLWDRRPNVVTLKHRSQSPTFWEDNLWDIVKWIIIGVVGGILLLLATRAINQVWP